MTYTVIINDQSYDLPKKTLAISEKLDEVLRTDARAGATLREKYKKAYDCVADLIGRENAAEALGASVDECDVNSITLAFRSIVDAYDKPLDDYKTDRASDSLSSLPIDKLTALVEAAKQMTKIEEANGRNTAGHPPVLSN